MTQVLLNNAPIPTDDPFVNPRGVQFKEGQIDQNEARLSKAAIDWLTVLNSNVNLSEVRIGEDVGLSNLSASIGATDFSGGVLNAGLYEAVYYAQITQAATISSSLTITFDWLYGGVVQSHSFAAITGNTVTTNQGDTLPLFADGAPIRFSTTYASVGATPMKYALYVELLRIRA
jgi:hypothetical protein